LPNINITSDLTTAGTKLTIDGEAVTTDQKVVHISFYASSPRKSDADEGSEGYINLRCTTVDDNGNVLEKDYGRSKWMSERIGMGIEDFEGSDNSALRYIGEQIDQEKKSIADKIVDHCKEKKLICPEAEVLYGRTKTSLSDKAEDLGIKLED
tara:strand:+ start:1222 stop:1680 length:459 start_codon:yes stop_codon:yes gene_type:complete